VVIHGRLAGAVCESRTADGGGDGGDGGDDGSDDFCRHSSFTGSLDRWIADLQAFRSVSVLSRPARMHSTTPLAANLLFLGPQSLLFVRSRTF